MRTKKVDALDAQLKKHSPSLGLEQDHFGYYRKVTYEGKVVVTHQKSWAALAAWCEGYLAGTAAFKPIA
jgi:hypothetical protein